MAIRVSALGWVPDFARGYVKDLRVRWALEEAGLPYETVLLDADAKRTDVELAWQPFGQVPAYRDDDVSMFESGAIVLYIASKSDALTPTDVAGRVRVASWVFAATTSIQPYVDNYAFLRALLPDERRSVIDERLMSRLDALESWLGDKDYLEGFFSAGDLMMTAVIREVQDGLLDRFPKLSAFHERCTTRPAFKRALNAQLADFRVND